MLIGQLAERLGVTTKSIRFYESIGLLPKPARTASGYRVYEDADAERLTFVKTAQRLGLRLDEIREIIAFRDRGERPCDYVAEVVRRQLAELDDRIREMCVLRDELERLHAQAAAGDDDGGSYCGAIEHAARRDLAVGTVLRTADGLELKSRTRSSGTSRLSASSGGLPR